MVSLSYLVTHGETPVVRGRSPKPRDKGHVGEVYKVEPTIKDKPAGGPVIGYKVLIADTSKSPAVDEEKDKDDDDGAEDAPPKLAVHSGLDGLLPLDKVLHGGIERVQSPDVEGGQRGGQGEYDQQDKGAGRLWCYRQAGNGVDDAKDKVGDCQPAHPDHGSSQMRLYDTVSHAHNQQQEEAEAVSASTEDADNNHQSLCAAAQAVSVLEIVEQPGHEDLDDEEGQDGGDVVLDRQDVMPVLEIEKGPAGTHEGVDEGQDAVERKLSNLSGGKLSVGIAELDNALVLVGGVAIGADTVVAGALDGIVDGRGIAQVDGLGDDLRASLVGIIGQDELALFCAVAELGLCGGCIANVGTLL